MKSSKEVMDNFMENWKNMINEEKKIVSTQECRESRKMIEIDDER